MNFGGDKKWERRQASGQVALDPREDSHVLRSSSDFSRIHQRGSTEWDISSGIFTWWFGPLWNFHRSMGRQEVISVKAPRVTLKIKVGVNEVKLREWASKNAYTLIVMSAFFVITWVLIVVANYWTAVRGGK